KVAKRARVTIEALQALLADDIAACQRNGDIAADMGPGRLAALVLAVLRGIEALGKAGASEETLTDIAQTALAVLPAPRTELPRPDRRPGDGRARTRRRPGSLVAELPGIHQQPTGSDNDNRLLSHGSPLSVRASRVLPRVSE